MVTFFGTICMGAQRICHIIFAIAFAAGAVTCPSVQGQPVVSSTTEVPVAADVVVYGATPGGIALAVRAAREGRSVVLVGHAKRIGGMYSYGLGAVDSLYQGPRSPFFDEFITRVHTYYRDTYGAESPQYKSSRPNTANVRVESRVAEQLFEGIVAREPRITLRKGLYPVSLSQTGAMLESATFRAMEGEETFTVTAQVFADCSYEGDFLALAKVPYRVGREGRGEYNEEHAGRIFVKEVQWPPPDLDPDYIARYRALNIKHTDRWSEIIYPQSTGESDSSVQAYSIRFLLSSDPTNFVPIEKPPGYDRDALFERMQKSLYWRSSVPSGDIPNNKFFINQPEIIGAQNRYVEGTWAERQQVIDEHRTLIHELLYFYQNDATLPAAVREGWSKLGLPRDEFTDSGHLPDEIYVREARRIVGRAMLSENNLRLAPGAGRAPVVPDSVGVAEWYLDSHACTPERVSDSLWEGEFYLHNKTWPGQVPLGSLLPQGIDNLLVPVCLGATHVGFGSVRVEPVWVSLSEAAAHVALLALERQIAPAHVRAESVQRRLADRKFLLSFFNDIAGQADADWYPSVQYLGTKGFFGDYDAKPDQPVTEAVAEAWFEAVRALGRGAVYDATELSVQCWRAEKVPSPPLSRREFFTRLAGSLRSPVAGDIDTGADLETPLSRAEACRLIYAALEQP